MTGSTGCELTRALMRPHECPLLTPSQTELLIRQGRAADVLGQLAHKFRRAGVWDDVPEGARMHLASAEKLAQRQHVELHYEVAEIGRVLAAAGIRGVLLKGAAYVLLGLEVAQGRLVSDVDVLVDSQQLAEAESALMLAGWITTNPDTYDQSYYRRWMHELPPMRHVARGAVLDLHHAILPKTAKLSPATDLLLREVVVLEDCPDLAVLSRYDMVLHSAVHLMFEGELELGFRGLLDLDSLITEFSVEANFWPQLVARATLLNLQWPLFLALRYMASLIGTAVPPASQELLKKACGPRASGWRLRWLDRLYGRALQPDHASLDDRWTGLARFLLYIRSHALRMPYRLLLPHLIRKSIKGMSDMKTREVGA